MRWNLRVSLSTVTGLLGVVLLSSVPALALEYSNDALHYRIVLPDGWEEIPKDVIDEAFAGIAAQSGTAPQQYEAGFQESSAQYFTYPYVLIQHEPLASGTISQIAKSLSKTLGDVEEYRVIQKLKSSGLVTNIGFGQPVADSRRKMILTHMESEYAGVETIKALLATAPGKQGMVNIYFYARKSEYEDYLSVAESVLDGFAFDSGYEYTWARAVAQSPIFSGVLGKAVAGAIAAALIGTIAVLLMRRKKRREI